ncbi:hypothetical protein [Massilia aquatica]|uniref:Uncharacterized protein n=1 Tax=Massilia aquatica TaxID=2609000 RepID=A0ABX0MKQ6_9BURK|nr:hypothetical protein [Massilia aquatica]NHZ42771.1 hypothetical protein [Massilia aquatica]
MRKLMKLQWHDLRDQLLLLDDHAEPEAIFRTLVAYIRQYRPQFTTQPFSHLRFARFFNMQAADYPVAQSTMRDDEWREVKQDMLGYEVRENLHSIMALLSDTLERLITLRIDACCPECGYDDVATYKGLASGEFVMQCALCRHRQGRNGAADVTGPFTFASAADMRLPGRPPAPCLPLPAQLSPRIRVDAGEMVDYNLVVLSHGDAETDSAGTLHDFYRGMPVAIFDHDTGQLGQPGHVIADGHAQPASPAPRWAPTARWLCRIDNNGLRRAPAAAYAVGAPATPSASST